MKPNTVQLKEFFGGSMHAEGYKLLKHLDDPFYYVTKDGEVVGKVVDDVIKADRESDVRIEWYEIPATHQN